MPDESKRLAASRPNRWQNYIYTPHADDLAMHNPDRKAQVRYAALPHFSSSLQIFRQGLPA